MKIRNFFKHTEIFPVTVVTAGQIRLSCGSAGCLFYSYPVTEVVTHHPKPVTTRVRSPACSAGCHHCHRCHHFFYIPLCFFISISVKPLRIFVFPCEIARVLPAFVRVWSSEPDREASFCNLKLRTAELVLLYQMPGIRILPAVFPEPAFQSGVVCEDVNGAAAFVEIDACELLFLFQSCFHKKPPFRNFLPCQDLHKSTIFLRKCSC